MDNPDQRWDRLHPPDVSPELTLRMPRRLTVSVIIPTYNRADLVSDAVASVLSQTFPASEIIVIDDGSTDNTVDVLRGAPAPVAVVSQANCGLSAARNRGLAEATCDVIVFLDSDDLLLPACLERVVDALEAHPEVDVVHSNYYLIDREGNRLDVANAADSDEPPSGMVLDKLGYAWFLINVSSAAVRRSALGEITFDVSLAPNASGRPVIGFAEDFEFWRMLSTRSRFLYLKEVLACYRYHESQVTASEVKTLEGAIEVQRRIMAMPQFADVPRRNKAKLYCSHGARQSLLGRGGAARGMFWRAVWASPSYPTGLVLLGLSLFGNRAVRSAILKRRRIRATNPYAAVPAPASGKTNTSSPQLADVSTHG